MMGSKRTNQMKPIPASELRINDIVYKEFGKERILEFMGVVQSVQPLRDSVGVYVRFTHPTRPPITIHREHVVFVVR